MSNYVCNVCKATKQDFSPQHPSLEKDSSNHN